MANSNTKVLVTGAGGFIGHHLVTFLKKKPYWVRGVDIKMAQFFWGPGELNRGQGWTRIGSRARARGAAASLRLA